MKIKFPFITFKVQNLKLKLKIIFIEAESIHETVLNHLRHLY